MNPEFITDIAIGIPKRLPSFPRNHYMVKYFNCWHRVYGTDKPFILLNSGILYLDAITISRLKERD